MFDRFIDFVTSNFNFENFQNNIQEYLNISIENDALGYIAYILSFVVVIGFIYFIIRLFMILFHYFWKRV